MSALREALREQLLARLREAWDDHGVGTLDVGEHYVQWAMYPEGLQLECVSNAFLQGDERMGFVQRRKLVELGFRRPDAEVPNHYRRFETEAELPAAADVLVQIIEEVLDASVLAHQLPRPGNVCFVVPVGKCFPDVLKAVSEPMIAASSDRRPTVVIDASGFSILEKSDVRPIEDWLAEPHAEEFPANLSLFFSEGDAGDLLVQAASLARALELLRVRGAHVIVIGPSYLPPHLWLYNGLAATLADGLIAVGNALDVHAWERHLDQLFRSDIQYTVLVGFGPEPVAHAGVRWTVQFDDDAGSFTKRTAAALGLHELAGEYSDHGPFG